MKPFVEEHKWGVAAGTLAMLIVVQVVVSFLRTYVWRPRAIRKMMKAQGVSGPTPKLITGNLGEIAAIQSRTWKTPIGKPGDVDHDYVSHVFPHYKAWGEKYGPKFLMWWGEQPAILETDLGLVVETFNSKHDGAFGKYSRWEVALKSVIGLGLPIINGTVWAKRRHMIQPSFHADKLKELVTPLISAAQTLITRWDKSLEAGGEWTHDVDPDMVKVAGDMISRAAFHSNYGSSHGAFEKQLKVLKITFESIAWSFIPLYSWIPTPSNIQRWILKYQVESTLRELIDSETKAADIEMEARNYIPKDLLGLLISANRDPDNIAHGSVLTKDDVLHELRTFFTAGFDTTAASLSWAMLCLAINPIWQEHIFEETKEVCGDAIPDANTINKLKSPIESLVQRALGTFHTEVTSHNNRKPKRFFPTLVLAHGRSVWSACGPLLFSTPKPQFSVHNRSLNAVFIQSDRRQVPSYGSSGAVRYVDHSDRFLTTLGLVISECLRLYSPGPQLARTAMHDVQLGDIKIPKGLSVFICVPRLHRLPHVWGSDANEFKPERFKNGVANACSDPMAYMPFSTGPRFCVAKNFALLELKIVICMIVQKFKFTLSPTYSHNPVLHGIVLKPRHGLPLIISKR